MYVIRNKKTKEVLFIDTNTKNDLVEGKMILPKFDKATMEIGRTDKRHIPEHFYIDKDGNVVEILKENRIKEKIIDLPNHQKIIQGNIVAKTMQDFVDEGAISLEEIKEKLKAHFSEQAFSKRNELVPDYKLINATLGVYEKRQLDDYAATIKGFRDEYYRIEAAIDKADTVKKLENIRAKYPTKILSVEM